MSLLSGDNAVESVSAYSQCDWPALPPPVPVVLVVPPKEPCPYLPERAAQFRAVYADRMPAELYCRFMDAGFRRSGKIIYQPICSGCRACVPLRVAVSRFSPGKSQRRCRRRNGDLKVDASRPVPTDEKFELYRRYMVRWHGAKDEINFESFESFLYDSPVDSVEFTYRDPAGRLLAVGICDVSSSSLSSVYYWHEPDEWWRRPGDVRGVV